MTSEYILQLRKHIQEGRRQESTHSLHRYVNSVAFWKDSYNEAIAAQAELKVRINELERVNDTLLSKLNLADRPGFELSNGKRRKKSADSRTGAVRRSSGQIKVWNHPSEVSVRVDIAELEVYGTSAESKRPISSYGTRPDRILFRQAFHVSAL